MQHNRILLIGQWTWGLFSSFICYTYILDIIDRLALLSISRIMRFYSTKTMFHIAEGSRLTLGSHSPYFSIEKERWIVSNMSVSSNFYLFFRNKFLYIGDIFFFSIFFRVLVSVLTFYGTHFKPFKLPTFIFAFNKMCKMKLKWVCPLLLHGQLCSDVHWVFCSAAAAFSNVKIIYCIIQILLDASVYFRIQLNYVSAGRKLYHPHLPETSNFIYFNRICFHSLVFNIFSLFL